MTEPTVEEQWAAVGAAVAVLAKIKFGEVTFRIENERFSGKVEMRETLRLKVERSEDGGN